MAAIKSYTDIEQSKKLAEILPLESADMIYIMYCNGEKPQNGDANLSTVYESNEHNWYWVDIIDGSLDMCGEDIPCWSLAALLGVLPKIGSIQKVYYANNPTEKYICQYGFTNITGEYDNPIDACYELILKLNELKML